MEGTYGTAFPPNASPMSPNTPTSASNGQYKTNVNRTKTRKWVEAKVQSYDGDDWGNEYDDEEPEPEQPPMPPPPRVTGFRQPGQGLSTSSQPASPALGPTQPAAAAGPSTGMRGVSGPPALHIQTQPPPSASAMPGPAEMTSPLVSGPSSLGSATIEQIVSPQSANPGQGVAPGAYAAAQDLPQRVVSPSSDRRMSPAPQGVSQLPSRFPPRKSSIGQQEPVENPDVARFSQSSSRPSSSHSKPWMQDRPASPSGPRSPGTPSKPLPFIRPADIYRRMEEEKEKERRSMDSSRPSMDSVTGRGLERVASPTKPAPEPVRPQQEAPVIKDEAPEPEADSNVPPPPVARKKSDYDYRGILAGAPGPAPKSTTTVSDPSSLPPHYAEIPKQQQRDSIASQDSSDDDARRFSTSPKLPDLARMSAFGADLFSGSSGFDANAPPLPSIPDNSPLESAVKSPAQQSSQEDVISIPSNPSPLVESSPPTADKDVENEASLKTEESANTATNAGFLRPSLPGGWISETVTTPGDGATPGSVPDPAAKDSGGVSPMTESGTDTDRSHGAPAQDLASGDGTSESAGDESGSRGIGLGVSQHATPQSLPPLNTAETAPIMSEPQPEDAAAGPPPPPPKDSPKTQPTSPAPDTATSDIAPTAPLQPHKGDTLDQDFRPEAIQRISTMSTVTNSSPVKESDVLREEIIKTLSPIRSSELFLNVGSPVVDEPSEQVDRNPVRESAYLDDVYGDYWAGNEKKPDTLPEEDEGPEPEEQVSTEEATPAVPAPETTVAQAPQQQKAVAAQPGASRNRFSWELDSEEVNANPPQASPTAPESANIPLPSSDQSTPLSPGARQQDIPQLTVETSAGGMSHQVSQASTLPPRRESEIPEPPSPVSVLTDRNVPPPEEGRRLSLAEEKVLIQASSHPVSPTPPSEQHPALADTSRSTPRTATPMSPSTPSPDLMSFRQILDLPNTSDRIAKYQETRAQFAGLDSGLDEWLIHIRSHIPEHANASGTFNYPLSMAPPAADGQNYPPVAVPPGVQPYYQQYQQYLSASTTNLHSPPGGRPMGGLAGSSQFGSSDMRHSSAQVGAKGKELLMAAGKAGKGLWGKSKNKLRGTGDKDDSSPPSSPPISPTITPVKEKRDKSRRASWGLASLGVRSSRTSLPAPGPAPARASFGGGSSAAAAPSTAADAQARGQAQFAPAGAPGQQRPRYPGLLGSLGLTSSATSRNASGAHANPNPNVNPNPPSISSSSSLPFQLPQPSRISPFNSNSFLSHGGDHSSSSPFPPPPRPPQQQHQTPDRAAFRASTGGASPVPVLPAVAARRNSQPELVSPVSETFSRSTPAPTSTAVAAPPQSQSQPEAYAQQRDDREHDEQEQHFQNASNLHVPPPISKHQPSWDPFTGTPLYEEEGFDLDDPVPKEDPGVSLGSSGSHIGAVAAVHPVASSAPAHTSVHLNTADDAKNEVIADDRSDDWVVVSPQPKLAVLSAPAPIRTVLPDHQPQFQPQLSQPRGARHSMPPSQGPVTSANISGPSGQPQADSSSSPHRQSSFVGLPPIRRSSTFGMSLTKATEELTVNEGDRSESPTANPPGATNNMSQIAMSPQQASSPPPGQPMQGGYYMIQGQPMMPQGFVGPGNVYYQHPGMQQQVQGPYAMNMPPQMQAQMAQRGMPGPSMMNAGPGQQQFRPGPQFMQPQPGMVPPNMMANGNPIQRLPPQGPWKLEESHLSEPLQSARHRSSPSNASASPSGDQGNYGFDKETGAPSITSVSPPIQSPTQQRPGEAPPQANVSRFGPGQQPRQQPQQGGQPPQSSFQQPSPPFAQPQNNMLARTQTSEIQSPQTQDENENKRNSGIFSGLRDRFGANVRERRDSLNGPRFQGPAVTGDGVSESSITTEEAQDRKKRQSTLFSLRGPGSGSENISPPSRQGTFDQQPQPLEKVRTFFSKPSGLSGPSLQPPQARPELSRASTSDSSIPVGAGGDGQPKKRFSALKGMFHKPGGHQDHPQQQGPPATAHSMQSSMQSQQPPQGAAPPAQPGVNGPPQMSGASGPPQGRPFTADNQGRKQSMQGPTPQATFGAPEAERGRRTSAGGFLSGILGKRSDSKSRDSKPQQGQPQQGQMMPPPGQRPGPMMMQGGPQGQFPMQQGQFQQFAGRGIGPQGQPLGPPGQMGPMGPMGQPQFLAQQGGRGAPLTPQQMHMMHMMMIQQQQQQQQQGQMPPGQQRLMTPQQPSSGPINQNTSPLAQHPVGLNAQRPGMPPQQPSQSSIQEEQPLQRSPQPDSTQQAAQTAQPMTQAQGDESQPAADQSSQLKPGPQPAAPAPVGQSSQSEPEVSDQRQLEPAAQAALGDAYAQNRASAQSSSSATPQPSLQTPARKPVGSSPAPVVSQQGPSLASSQPDQRSIASSVQQSPQLGSQGSPQLRRASTPSGGQNLQPGAQPQTAATGAQLPNISAQSTPSASPAPQAGQQAPPPATSPQPGMMQGPQGSQQLQQGPPGQQQLQQQPSGPMGPGMQPQGPWIVSRASTQVSNMSGPPQPGQQFMQGPPQNRQMTSQPPQQEQQSTFSKFMNKAKSTGQPTSQAPGTAQQKPQKQEKGAKSLFGAFKRSSKQPEPNQPPPGGPQYGPGQGRPPPHMMQQMQRPPNGQQPPQGQMPGQQMRPGPYMQYQNQRQSPPNQQGPQPVPGASPQQPAGFPTQGPGQPQPGQPQQGQQFAQQRPIAQPQAGVVGAPRPTNQRLNEPQYAQVPIPAGYAPVHGEGMLVPSPYNIGRAPSYGQYPGPQIAQQYYQQPQWGPPGHMQQRQVSPGIPQGQQPMSPPQQVQPGMPIPEQMRESPQPQQVQGQPTTQPTGGAPQPTGLTPTPQATPGLSPVSSSPGHITQMNTVSPDSQGQQRPQPDRIATDASQLSSGSQPILQHPGSPQNYPLPESSTFSPVNPAAGKLPNPPLPQNFVVTTESPEQTTVNENTGLAPQRQPSAVSQVSSLQPSPPAQQEHTIANVISGAGNHLPTQSSPHAASLSPQITPERNVSPEPAVQTPVNLNVNAQAGNNVQEDIYDATPRNSVPPVTRQEQPADVVVESPSAEPASKFAGRPQDHTDAKSTISARSDERPRDLVIETAPPVAHEPTTNGHERPPNGNGKPVQSSADIFEEMKRKQLLREQEEKIPVNPTEPDMHAAAAAAAKKKDEDDVPQMSATSYPGQEWNPYGGAEYEDWND